MDQAFKPRKRPVQQRSRATYDAILEGAAQVLKKHGYAKATTNAIAKRAGVSIGSLYEYFPDKEAVFAALQEKLHRAQFETVIGRLSLDPDTPPEAAIRQLLKARIETALDQPDVVAILQKEVPASVFSAELKEDFAQFSDVMSAFAQRHKDKIRIKNLETAIPLGIQMVDLIINHMAAHRVAELKGTAFLDELSDMMCCYILKDQV